MKGKIISMGILGILILSMSFGAMADEWGNSRIVDYQPYPAARAAYIDGYDISIPDAISMTPRGLIYLEQRKTVIDSEIYCKSQPKDPFNGGESIHCRIIKTFCGENPGDWNCICDEFYMKASNNGNFFCGILEGIEIQNPLDGLSLGIELKNPEPGSTMAVISTYLGGDGAIGREVTVNLTSRLVDNSDSRTLNTIYDNKLYSEIELPKYFRDKSIDTAILIDKDYLFCANALVSYKEDSRELNHCVSLVFEE